MSLALSGNQIDYRNNEDRGWVSSCAGFLEQRAFGFAMFRYLKQIIWKRANIEHMTQSRHDYYMV
jgi:hypothetical protein